MKKPSQTLSKKRDEDDEEYNYEVDKRKNNINSQTSEDDMMIDNESSRDRGKNRNTNRSRSKQSALSSTTSGQTILMINPKKRKLGEIYEINQEDENDRIENSDDLWTQKYIPNSLVSINRNSFNHIIN